jgi:hypothetical protein
LTKKLRSLKDIGSAFHRIVLTTDAEKRLLHGLCVPAPEAGRYIPGGSELGHGLYVEGEGMIGFVGFSEEHCGALLLKPKVNIVVDESSNGR